MPATQQAVDSWFAGAPGRPMNPDNAYGLQCKDVADDYCNTLFGSWYNTIRPGNGKDVFNNADPTYFHKVLNNPNDPNQIPPRGAIINWSGTRAVPEGHVAIVESADATGLTVIQQDGYLQYPARRVRLSYVLPNGANVIGWLIPKLQPTVPNANDSQIDEAFRTILERGADAGALVHYRQYSIDFVRADLRNSQEYRDLQNRKAQVAQEAADAARRAAALLAEQQRLAEEQAAAERLRIQAEQLAREAEEAKKRLEEEAAKPIPQPTPVQPADGILVTYPETPKTSEPTTETKPPQPNPLVRILFQIFLNLFKKK